MDCSRAEELLSSYIDNELSEEEMSELGEHLKACQNCRHALHEYTKLKRTSSAIKLIDPPAERMENYWANISARLSRRCGWILFIVGSAILAIYAIYQFALDRTVNSFLKIVIAAIAIGLVMIFISVLIERLREMRNDRYTGVQK